MGQLYTVTGNLLAETTVRYHATRWGDTHRGTAESFQVGGKGINVARMAHRLQLSATAVVFPGGDTGARCLQWLADQPFHTRAFPQQQETRAGWVVRAKGVETTFLGCDRSLEQDPWGQAMQFLRDHLHPGDMLAVCGSLPGWTPQVAQCLHELLEALRGKVFVAVDTYGQPLSDLLRHRLDLIKVNRSEIEPLLEASGQNDLVEFLTENPEASAARRWVVTDGPAPMIARDADGSLVKVTPPAVQQGSAVGSGDVMLAGLLWGLAMKNLSFKRALDLSAALASANAASPGIADFDVDRVLGAAGWQE